MLWEPHFLWQNNSGHADMLVGRGYQKKIGAGESTYVFIYYMLNTTIHLCLALRTVTHNC